MRVPPPVIALAAGLAQRALTKGSGRPSGIRRLLAATTAAGSATLAGAASAQFRHRRTTVDPVHPARASALVTTGPNALTRNPMYVGMAGVLLAHAILRGSWRALVPLVGFVVVIDRVQIAAEEAALTEVFGDAYAAYRAEVPRWLGPLGSPTRR
jgi:protein-S-isoprenylcysteine O-methyltransferase Ste14